MLGEGMSARLLALGTSTLYEAGRPLSATRALDPGIRPLWHGAALCGPAYPVACAEADNLAVHRAMEHCGAGDVLVVDGRGALVGYWGEILTVAAQARGIAGLVVDGGARDIDALHRRQFPVFARGAGMPGAAKKEPGRIGEPIRAGGAGVGVGDVVVADCDGVLVIDAARAADVLAAAEERAAAEDRMMAELTTGALTIDLLGLRPSRD
jgi:4-hydroxy-4-methyl-2-oxoglutarate aldolase